MMNRRKMIVCFALAVILGICLAACSAGAQNQGSENAPDIANLDREETYPDVPGSLEVIYRDIAELERDADCIAEVTVQNSEVIPLDGFPRTHSQAKVVTALKGDLKTGDVIEVIEEGGRTDKGEAIAGVPVMDAGSTYILFLHRTDDAWFIVGAFQGKFIVKEGYVFQQATEETKIQSYSPQKIEDFRESVATPDAWR